MHPIVDAKQDPKQADDGGICVAPIAVVAKFDATQHSHKTSYLIKRLRRERHFGADLLLPLPAPFMAFWGGNTSFSRAIARPV